MQFYHWNLGQRNQGDVVVVNVSGNAANVRLLDSANFQNYKSGRRHTYYGGLMTRSPSEIPIPHSGTWHIAADMQGLRGQSRTSVQVVTREARRPLRPYQPPSLEPIAQAMANRPPNLRDNDGDLPLKEYDVFISHATEDKDEVVRPLANALRASGLTVWYDEFELSIGDSLRRKIDAGISHSKFGVVVLSAHFFAKGWPQYELDGITTMSVSGTQAILPIWHNLTEAQVIAESPSLAEKVARSTANFTIEQIAEEISQVIQRQP